MYNKRTWEGFYESFIITGVILIVMCGFLLKYVNGKDVFILLGMFILGCACLIFGVYKRVKRYQETHLDTNYEIDQTKEYVFTMQTSQDHIETVNSYAQMEEAIKNLDKMKQGCVEIKIQPPMGGIKQINVF